jgi:hypothetical protein
MYVFNSVTEHFMQIHIKNSDFLLHVSMFAEKLSFNRIHNMWSVSIYVYCIKMNSLDDDSCKISVRHSLRNIA